MILRTATQVMDNVADFNATYPNGHGCEICGGSIAAVFDRITTEDDSTPIMVLDIAHSDAACTVLAEQMKKGTGAFPLGAEPHQLFYRHRFDDGETTWRDPRFGSHTPTRNSK